jgi:predicted metal-dependent phosphoesterase TrpH
MASYLYYVDTDNFAVLDDEARKLCPELGKLSKREFTFVVLVEDYGSPYHQMIRDERLKRAKRHVFSDADSEIDKDPLIVAAIEMYHDLQFDVDKEVLRNYREKIVEYSIMVAEAKSPRDIKELDSAIEALQKRCAILEKTISENNATELRLRGGGKLSFIEKWQQNQRNAQKAMQRQQQLANQGGGDDKNRK